MKTRNQKGGKVNIPDRKIVELFKYIAEVQIGLKPGEHVLIVTDPAQDPRFLEALNYAVSATGAICTTAMQPNVGWSKSGNYYALTEPIKKAYMGAEVVIAATFSSNVACYGRPQAFRDAFARKENHRLFLLGLRTLEDLVADAETDYYKIKEIQDKIADILVKTDRIRIKTDNGTDFCGSLKGVKESIIRDLSQENGICTEPGMIAGRPNGEVHVPPEPESMEGILVIDGDIANICRRPDKPVRITVEKGKIVNIEGGADARKLDALLSSFDVDQHTVSEVAISTNKALKGRVESEAGKRAWGNFHVAYGGWWGFQDTIPYRIHGDMVMGWTPGSTYLVDGKPLFENGDFTFEY
jgi:leucyl aminopeptidase (aminopeptidase T)